MTHASNTCSTRSSALLNKSVIARFTSATNNNETDFIPTYSFAMSKKFIGALYRDFQRMNTENRH